MLLLIVGFLKKKNHVKLNVIIRSTVTIVGFVFYLFFPSG